MIYWLLITVIIFLIASYYLFDKEILAPAVVLCAVYVFSIICAIYNINYWGMNLHLNTFLVISLGILCFIFFSYICKLFFKKTKNAEKISIKNKEIKIQNFKIIAVTIFMILFAIIYAYSVRKLAQSYGYTEDYTELMAEYRENTSYGEDSLPGWINQFNKIMKAVAYLFTYVFVNNVIVSKKLFKNIKYALPFIIYMGASLFGAQRSELLSFVIILLTISYLLMARYNIRINTVNKKYVKRGAVIVIIFLVTFSSVRGLVGRQNESDTLDYITSYGGGSIELLDLYLQEPIYAEKFGEETFYALTNTLSKFGITEKNDTIPHLEFRYSSTGILIGNVYTAFRKYIHDFGYWGVFIFQMILAMFYTIFYYKTTGNNKNKSAYDLKIQYYSIMIVPLFMHSIQEQIFSSYFTLNTLVLMFLVWIWYVILIKYKFIT